jgi:flagellar basal-body rod protein FlgC
MSFSVSGNISALFAFGKKMGVTANNIANVQSDEFKKSRTVLKEGLHGDVQVDIDRIETEGPLIPESIDGETTYKEGSNVDLAEEIPQTIPTQRGYEANLKVIQTKDEMLGSLLDIIG